MSTERSAIVLGGTGFIGGHIIKLLADGGWEVHALRRRPGSVGHVGGLKVRWHDGDLNRIDTLDVPLSKGSVLFHAAGYVPANSRDVPAKVAQSVQQTRNVCEAARRAGIDKMVYTSTLTTIGTPPPGSDRLADERDSYLPGSVSRSAYYECKDAMEREVLHHGTDGLPVVVVNPTFVLGPEDREGTIGVLMRAIAGGWGRFGIEAEQNVVDVRDVAQGHLRAASEGKAAERYILGGTNIRVDRLMARIAALLGKPGPSFNLPSSILAAVAHLANFGSLGALSNHLFGIGHWQSLNVEKAQRDLGFKPRPLDETLKDTIQWYQEQGIIPPGKIVV